MRGDLKGYKDLDVYQLSYKMAIEIFEETKNFPKEEKFSLTDQIRRSSRSIASNIAESWGKRMYRNHFVNKLSDSYAEANETQTWLDFSLSHSYMNKERYDYFTDNYDHISRMLFNMMKNPEKFLLKL
ncbi:four helix bundle protein [candidate division WOR-3 bacterium]|nr:four helix bundle protein [candidate division WOR-3 bacterium]